MIGEYVTEYVFAALQLLVVAAVGATWGDWEPSSGTHVCDSCGELVDGPHRACLRLAVGYCAWCEGDRRVTPLQACETCGSEHIEPYLVRPRLTFVETELQGRVVPPHHRGTS